MGHALDDGPHGFNFIESFGCKKRVDFIHLRKECTYGIVEMYLFDDYLPPVNSDRVTGEAQRPDLEKEERIVHTACAQG